MFEDIESVERGARNMTHEKFIHAGIVIMSRSREWRYILNKVNRRRTFDNDTRCTIAWKHVTRDSDGNDVIDIGISWCSPYDMFSKADGRKRALRRLKSDPVRIKIENDGCIKCKRPTSSFGVRLRNTINCLIYANDPVLKTTNIPQWVECIT